MRAANTKAITLVEIMITTVLFMVITAGLYTTFIAGNQSWNRFENNVTLQREARGALIAMTKELREASSYSITASAGNTSISFNRPSVGAVSYTWTNTGVNANKVIRTGTTTRTLANNISALTFTDLTTAIQVDITASKTQTTGQVANFSMKEKVALR